VTKIILYLISGSLSVGQVEKDQIPGSWQGVLNTGNQEIRLAFNISFAEDGSSTATLDSPDQGAMGLPLGEALN
jgi:hypothetical protein